MSEPDRLPLSGLFDLAAPGAGRDLKRSFIDADLNNSVRGLLAYLDKLFSVAAEPGWVFLTTIENDAEAGRFPEVLRNFFTLGGVQVRESAVMQAVTLNPFNVADATQLASLARLAWAASRDLDKFGLNISAGHDVLARVDQIPTAW